MKYIPGAVTLNVSPTEQTKVSSGAPVIAPRHILTEPFRRRASQGFARKVEINRGGTAVLSALFSLSYGERGWLFVFPDSPNLSI